MRPCSLVVTAALGLGACGGSSPVSFGDLEDGATLGGAQHTHLDVSADQDVVRVELYLDGARVGEAPFAPFDIAWSTAPFAEGEHALRGTGYLVDGSRVEGTIHVTFDNTGPVVDVLEQVYGDGLRIHASDNTGVAAVELHVADEVRPAIFNGQVYVAPWDRPCGPATIEVIATDVFGWKTTYDRSVVSNDLNDSDCDGYKTTFYGGDDCNDFDATVHPGAADDGTVGDTNCDGVIGTDADGDRVASVATGGTDCDDHDAGVHAGTKVWSKLPFYIIKSGPVHWTPGAASIDGTTGDGAHNALALDDSGSIEVTTAPPGGEGDWPVQVVVGANHGAIALAHDPTSYLLAYGKGNTLHVKRWPVAGPVGVPAVDELVATAAAPIGDVHLRVEGDVVYATARADQAIVYATRQAGAWRSAAIAAEASPISGPLALAPGGDVGFVGGSHLESARVEWAATPIVHVSDRGVVGPITAGPSPSQDRWIVATGGTLIARDAAGVVAWTATTGWTDVVRIIDGDGATSLAVGHDAAGVLRAGELDHTSGAFTRLPLAIVDPQIGTSHGSTGDWVAMTPGFIYWVGGTVAAPPDPPGDGVDRDCDGND